MVTRLDQGATRRSLADIAPLLFARRIIKRAGLAVCPKLWQNLLANRATELAAEFPAHAAAAWLGHSTLVAQKNYWQVTDADYDKAVSTPMDNSLQKALQSGRISLESGRGETLLETSRKPGKNRGKCEEKVTPTGLEPVLPA